MDKKAYTDLLSRAKENLPERIKKEERFKIPDPDLVFEGKTTILRNFGDIAMAINRDGEQMFAFLLKELGTAGNLDGRRGIFKGRLIESQLVDRVTNYIETYVLCSECKRPDTRLVKDGRVLVLECDACGAHRPVKVRKGGKAQDAEALVEGNVYEVVIGDVGRKGDGVAKIGKYTIYVPRTTKGNIVKIKISKISGTIAFAEPVVE